MSCKSCQNFPKFVWKQTGWTWLNLACADSFFFLMCNGGIFAVVEVSRDLLATLGWKKGSTDDNITIQISWSTCISQAQIFILSCPPCILELRHKNSCLLRPIHHVLLLWCYPRLWWVFDGKFRTPNHCGGSLEMFRRHGEKGALTKTNPNKAILRGKSWKKRPIHLHCLISSKMAHLMMFEVQSVWGATMFFGVVSEFNSFQLREDTADWGQQRFQEFDLILLAAGITFIARIISIDGSEIR